MTTLQEVLARSVELTREKRQLKAREKEVNDELRQLTQQALELMLDGGQIVKGVRVNGMTVYVQEKIFGRPMDGDMERLCAALKQRPEYAPLVKEAVHSSSLNAFVKEFMDETSGEVRLPADLQEVIAVSQFYDLGFRESS